MNPGAIHCNSQDDGPPKVLHGITALHLLVEQIKTRAENKEKIRLSDLDQIMPYKPPMTDEDCFLASNLAKNCISELGRVARDGASTTGSSSRHEATEKKTSSGSVMCFFG